MYSPYEIVQLTVNSQKGDKIGYLQCIIEKDFIKDISKYVPPYVIFDQNSKISPFLTFNMKKKKDNFITAEKAKLNLKNL